MSSTIFGLTELQALFPGLVPASFSGRDDAAFWLQGAGARRALAVLAPSGHRVLGRFRGAASDFQDGHTLLLCPPDSGNARSLRETLDWLAPIPLGLATSAGTGDRLGLATPGHVRAFRAIGGTVAPIFAQQSIREMQRTGRSPDDVMADATFGTFEAGWRDPIGADADHLKTTGDIDACLAAGFTFFTIDPSAHVDPAADSDPEDVVAAKVAALPWTALEIDARSLEALYAGRAVALEDRTVPLDRPAILRAAAKYGRAVAHVAAMYRHLDSKGVPFELEVSVDETDTPTSHAEHIWFSSELKRLGVRWVSLAPRFIGRFEKGVDYIGEVDAFEADFAVHAQIARALGPYKLSIHSGSDKFSIYPATMRQSRGLVHLKTAGTSYLEALRTIAALDAWLFRLIYEFALERYETDRASYHVSAERSRAPRSADVLDRDLPALLQQFDAREILHVTFGSVLTARRADGRFVFHDDLKSILVAHPEAYAANLERHFVRHLRPFSTRRVT
jgi:tagaturonate epimerase